MILETNVNPYNLHVNQAISSWLAGRVSDIHKYSVRQGLLKANLEPETMSTVESAVGAFISYMNNGQKFEQSRMLEIAKKLLNKTVEELLMDLAKSGHYNDVMKLSFSELQGISDLSDKKYNPVRGFFSRHKDNSIEIEGKKITLFRLNSLLPILLYQIPRINHEFFQANMGERVRHRCQSCNGTGWKTIYEKSSSYDQEGGRNIEYDHGYKTVECGACGGTGITSTKVDAFLKKYEKDVDELNKNIAEILPKVSKKIADYNKLVEETNKKIEIWNSKCPQNAIDHKASGIQKTSSHEMSFINQDLQQYRSLEALHSVNVFLENHPNDFEGLLAKANALAQLGRYDEALETTYEAEKIKPDCKVFDVRGYVCGLARNYEEALKQYDKALEIEPKDMYALQNKSITLVKIKRFAESIECAKKYFELFPKIKKDKLLEILWRLDNQEKMKMELLRGIFFDYKYYEESIAWQELIETYTKVKLPKEWKGEVENYKNKKMFGASK